MMTVIKVTFIARQAGLNSSYLSNQSSATVRQCVASPLPLCDVIHIWKSNRARTDSHEQPGGVLSITLMPAFSTAGKLQLSAVMRCQLSRQKEASRYKNVAYLLIDLHSNIEYNVIYLYSLQRSG